MGSGPDGIDLGGAQGRNVLPVLSTRLRSAGGCPLRSLQEADRTRYQADRWQRAFTIWCNGRLSNAKSYEVVQKNYAGPFRDIVRSICWCRFIITTHSKNNNKERNGTKRKTSGYCCEKANTNQNRSQLNNTEESKGNIWCLVSPCRVRLELSTNSMRLAGKASVPAGGPFMFLLHAGGPAVGPFVTFWAFVCIFFISCCRSFFSQRPLLLTTSVDFHPDSCDTFGADF